jgi:enoyl-CoA hydratase/carnithine racemase
VTIDNEPRMNAWDRAMRASVERRIADAATSPDVDALVMTGAGRRAFCAGMDFNEARDFTDDVAWIDEVQELYDRVRRFPKPLVAAVNGDAAGSGFQLALLADVRVGHRDLKFGQTEVRHGIPSITGTWLMMESLGVACARSMALRGHLLTGDEAHRLGLIDQLTPADQVKPAAMDVARSLGARAGVSYRITKEWIRQQTEERFRSAFQDAREWHAQAFATGEPQRMMAAFLD